MISLISTALGFVGSFIPELFKYFRAKEDRKHELAVMNLQMEATRQGHVQRLEEINTQADIDEQRIALEASKPQQITYTGNKVVDVLIGLANALLMVVNGLVRPTITYCYFWLYVMVKWAQWATWKTQVGATQALIGLWGPEDQAVFGAVIGFWFGSRTLKWAKERSEKLRA